MPAERGQTSGPGGGAEPRRHAVENGEILSLSVSQLKKFALCRRQWFFRYVRHYPEPTTKSQQTGIDGHKQIEHYLKTGQNVLGPIAMAGMPYLPAPGPGLLIEEWFGKVSPLTADGIPFDGYIDVVNVRRIDSDDVVRVTDHKFTSSLQYAARAEDLANASTEPGLQMVGYGQWILESPARFCSPARIELEHIYYQTRGVRAAENRLISVPASRVTDEWNGKVVPMVREMRQVARAEKAADVPANFGPACEKYGGCPHKAKCLSGEKTMSLLSRLKTQTTPPAASVISAQPHPSTATVGGQITATPQKVEAVVFDQLRSPTSVAASPVEPMCTSCGVTLNAENSSKLQSGEVKHIACPKAPAAVLPPDAPAPTKPAEPKPEPVVVLDPGVTPLGAKADEVVTVEKKRGRKPKSEGTVEGKIESISVTNPPIDVKTGFALFVDCVPFRSGEPSDLARYVAERAAEVAKAAEVDDIRFAPQSQLDFGKWRGALAMAIRQTPPAPGAWVALGVGQSELLQIAVETLEPTASLVVRAAR